MDDMQTLVVALAGMALLPFVFTMISSFAKIVIVAGILRQALGFQNTPPNTVLTGLALVLSLHIMSPLISEILTHSQAALADVAPELQGFARIDRVLEDVAIRVQAWLSERAGSENIAHFQMLRSEISREPLSDAVPEGLAGVRALLDTLTIHAPAFILAELSEAFWIGFKIYLPFLVIELVVSNVLLALGMQMMTPTTITLPLKIMLFVLIDGWNLLLTGLVRSYVVHPV